jgi:hypothetical protein
VASIFGMNTNDVRNMDLNQWAFWATAFPVTAMVIFLGLLWTGELGNIVRWVVSFGPRKFRDQAILDDPYYDRRDMYRAPAYLPPPPPVVIRNPYPSPRYSF